MKYLCIALLLLSCSDPFTERFVDPELAPYVESFYREAAARGLNPHRNVIVKFGKLKPLGQSQKRGWQTRVIVDRVMYEKFRADNIETPQRFFYGYENLMFHELGHAVLDYEHCLRDGIMHPYASIFEYAEDEELRKEMIDEFFQSCQHKK